MDEEILSQFIKEVLSKKISDRHPLDRLKRQFCRIHKIGMFRSDEMLRVYHNLVDKKIINKSKIIEDLFVLKQTRSQSGIAVVSVLTKPYDCPGRCLYCPTDSRAFKRIETCKYGSYLHIIPRITAGSLLK
jgi:elongator complex protein 3